MKAGLKGYLIMKNIIVVLALCLGSFAVSAANSKDVFHFQNEFENGVKQIKDNNFDDAFKHLEASSKLGNKTAQYELAILYARGQGTPQNFVQAYLWLTVATEVDEKRWEVLHEKISQIFTPEQLKSLAPDVNEYLSNYGKKSQEVICKRQSNMGSNVKYMFCEKLLDSGQVRLRTK